MHEFSLFVWDCHRRWESSCNKNHFSGVDAVKLIAQNRWTSSCSRATSLNMMMQNDGHYLVTMLAPSTRYNEMITGPTFHRAKISPAKTRSPVAEQYNCLGLQTHPNHIAIHAACQQNQQFPHKPYCGVVWSLQSAKFSSHPAPFSFFPPFVPGNIKAAILMD